jgi:hypothetical protein
VPWVSIFRIALWLVTLVTAVGFFRCGWQFLYAPVPAWAAYTLHRAVLLALWIAVLASAYQASDGIPSVWLMVLEGVVYYAGDWLAARVAGAPSIVGTLRNDRNSPVWPGCKDRTKH